MRQTWACSLATLIACASTETVPMAPHPSPYFDAVSAKLELGGTVYTYVDVDGDPERVAEFLLSLLRQVPSLGLGPQTSASKLVRVLGLDQIHAIGLSSYKNGALYRNRSVIYQSGPKEGVLKVFGGEPAAPDLGAVAPEGADLVWEQQVNLKALVDVLRALAERGIGASPQRIEEALRQQLLGLDFTVGQLVERLDTTAGLVVEIDEKRVLRIPGETVWFPYIDFFFQIDGLGELVDAVEKRAAFDPFIHAEKTARWVTIGPGIALPAPWNAYDPSLIKDRASGRVYLVSRPEYLEQSLAAKSRITDNPEFVEAFEGLPDAANGMLFLSSRFTREMHAIVDRTINQSGPSPGTTVARFMLPEAGFPLGWVGANQPEGLLFSSNSSSSHKSTLLTFGFAAMVPAILVTAASRLRSPREAPPPPPAQ